ncbi:VCBS domain-containing protein [Uliginosibacterium sp. H3]|uniref:VCBS domain-containing protein n=1 Tax=Uliginosibacterium silvisoli TaxID=3114758 RepID=A0ABU6JX32_9RHOO|nr:VCBS domain-containing protein [Uliginosibacterium sp. H3]
MLSPLLPRSQALALEPRILFDGAAAVAVEQHHADGDSAGDAASMATTPDAQEAPASAAPRNLVVIDSRVENRDQLLANLPADSKALVIGVGEDALTAISSALAEMGQVDSVQIFSHGAAGQFSLGDRNYSSDSLQAASATLQGWRGALSADADILLYGCNVGAGEAGQALVAELASNTGADVAASSDDTGAAEQGGNWRLEVNSGTIDHALALDAAAVSHYASLLADASPTTAFGAATADVLLGDQFTFTVNLSNASGQVGFAPFVDLFLPATGKDGDDGVSFVSASYLGQTLVSHVITFDANGQAMHPIAKDSAGNALIISAPAGFRAGDKLVVVELPYASVSNQQPTIGVQITASLSNLADTGLSNGNPDLVIKARGGFEYGNDALDNPASDPSLVEASLHSFTVHPTLVSLNQSLDVREGETATGPNYPHTQTLTVAPAPGQVLTNVVVTQDLPTSIQVTAITPGTGGVLTSITLGDGRVLTNATAINAAIASDTIFITSYTVTYASLSASTDQRVSFYVPQAANDGSAVLNPDTGNPVTINFGAATASGSWVPIDSRDITAPATQIDFSGTGSSPISFTAKSITLEKTATLAVDTGTSGLTPGDTLRYALEMNLSDYFGFGKTLFEQGSFTIVDTLADGQTLTGSATLTFTAQGVTQSVTLAPVVVTDSSTGISTLTFDIAAALLSLPGRQIGALGGDLAVDNTLQGATVAVLSYNAVIGQAYTSSYAQSEINEGDPVGNSATLTATVLADRVNLTGSTQSDQSSVEKTVPVSNIDIALTTVNGSTPPANGELHPGDLVTFRLSYNLVTGDYEQFVLTAYLPLPLFDLGSVGTVWTTGSGVGQWAEGAGDTNGDTTVSVTTGAGNSLLFNYGDYAVNATSGSRVEVQFTLRVGDQPFTDQRALAVLAQSSQRTTIDQRSLISSDAVAITSIAEPVLSMTHGVVSSSNGTTTITGWAAPGSTGVPFSGAVIDVDAIDGDVSGIDAGDLVRLATAIENTGGGGAFDVVTNVTLPTGLSFVGGSLATANLQIYRGDGTQLMLGTDYSVSGTTISFLDQGGVASLLAGRAGTAADSSGANVVVIVYDAVVSSSIDASRTLQSSAALTNYASVNGGTDFTPVDLTDLAAQQMAAPVIRKDFAGGGLDPTDSSASHTTGSNLVVGESMLYDLIITLPEGTTQSLRITDLIPAGLRLDTSFNGNQGYQLVTTAGGALTASFAGTVTVSGFAAPSGTLGDDGVDARITFSAASATADNNVSNNSFVVRLRLVANNVSGNQSGAVLQNDATLTYSDPDGDTANGSSPLDRNLGVTGGKPTVTIQEPTLAVAQQLLTTPLSPYGFDLGDVVDFSITLSNSSGINAFDLSLLDNLPVQLDSLTLVSAVYAGGATKNGGVDFEIVGGQLRTASGANIDIAQGGSVVITIRGTVNSQALNAPSFNNVATAQWTSLDGSAGGSADPAGERTGQDGALNGGGLNDYQRSSTLTINTAAGIRISRVGGLGDTAAPNPTNSDHEQVAIGEIVRYRVDALVPDGGRTGYQIQVTLAEGLTFIPTASNSVLVALISNGGLTSSLGAGLVSSGNPAITGDQDTPQAGFIAPDLSSPLTAVMNPTLISVSPDGRTITFTFGDLSNTDINDGNLEVVALEFNIRVSNQTSNRASEGDQLAVVARDYTNNGGTQISASKTLYEDIVEPAFTGLDKRVTSFNPNPAGSTGTAEITISFTQNGTSSAYDTHLTDSITGGSGYTLLSLKIGSTTYGPGNLPAGVTLSTSGGVTLDFTKIDPGVKITAVYSVTVPNAAAIASSNATLTWSSLPESFTAWGGSIVGSDSTADGERTGVDGAGAGNLNNYVLSEGAGLGIISGTLWNDTSSADSSTTPDGAGLAGQTVTLTWGGVDNDLSTTGDNAVFSTTTNGSGQYSFGVLAAGNYRIDMPTGTISYAQPLGDLKVRIDTDGATLGQILVAVGEGASTVANAGYVERNDAPVNQIPATTISGNEDTLIAIADMSIADVDAERDPVTGSRDMQVTLTVLHGTLSLASTPGGVTIPGGQGNATLVLQGRRDDINLALAQLRYQGIANFNGNDTLTMVTTDNGNFGDVDGDGIPGEASDDALSDTDTRQIVVISVNDPPVANNDSMTAVEAGGRNNDNPGTDPQVNVLGNDVDVDTDPSLNPTPDRLRVTSAGLQGAGSPTSIADGSRVQIVGLYGSLFISSGGGAQYVVDNSNATVQALRTSGQTLQETFTYTISDLAGATSGAQIAVTIQGADDTPVAADESADATEKGGIANATAGSDATGSVLANDSDIDAGDSLRVTYVRFGDEAHYENAVAVPGSSNSSTGASVAGTYGTLYIGSDGSFRYVINDNDARVQALSPGQTLQELFSYSVEDLANARDLAQLTIVIRGAADNPVASDDVAAAQAAFNNTAGGEVNPGGNVILNPSRPGTTDNGVDTDVDAVDQVAGALHVTGVRSGTEASGTVPGFSGSTTILATYATLSGSPVASSADFGSLTIASDGSFLFNVNSDNPDIQALNIGQPMQVIFSYQITDTAGKTDVAQLVVTVYGVNDPPLAQNVVALATERGGVINAAVGVDPSGNVLATATDVDGDTLSVTAVRTGAESASGTSITVGTRTATQYGWLTLNADGTYLYEVNNALADVQALRRPGDLLIERFTYTISDNNPTTPESDMAELIVAIRGQNDNPVAGDDTGTAIEAGGVNNNLPGQNALGNVLTNDSDVDGGEVPADLPQYNYGETRAVASVRTGAELGSGTAGTLGVDLRGTYGWLTLNADGTYSYRVDNSMAAVQQLRTSGNTLSDAFSYEVVDAAGALDRATLNITITGANDAPVAVNDSALATEKGGIANGTAGVDPSGNVLGNDTDVDAYGEALSVVGISRGGNSGTVGSAFAGLYGSLTLRADGSYDYVVDNSNPLVQALRTSSNTLTETFSYDIRDVAGLGSTATLSIVIRGANDNPVAVDDTAAATEAGGTANATAGVNPGGNLLSNDTDVDALDSKLVDGIRTGTEAAGGTFTAVSSSQAITGLYGTLTVNANGNYSYVVDNSLAAVQALRPGQTLSEVFTYRLHDTAGAMDTAQLTITVAGVWDAPVANNNIALAVAASGTTAGRDPTGNVVTDSTLFPADSDVDAGDVLTVNGIRTGTEAAGGGLTAVAAGTNSGNGTLLVGTYGSLIIGADGSYQYVVDQNNATVRALGPAQTVSEAFTYRITDLGGLTDLAQLTVTIRGRNDAPVAGDDQGNAIEASGLENDRPGLNPIGNVLNNDTDLESDPLSVSAVRTGRESGIGVSGTVGSALRGLYGDLTLNANGTWHYVVDNSLAAVQALRVSGQTLVEHFTYTVSDDLGATDKAELTVTIDGRNDTPVAVDDDATAVEAGGIANGIAGANPVGNVLSNDQDVDSVANGETRQVLEVSSELGQSAQAGQLVQGRYGALVLAADGSYQYFVDNDNAAVQALRTSGETLREAFTYRMRDTEGATSTARLNLLVQGANDNPVAHDDSVVAVDQTTPNAQGNVLGNDSDVDNGETRRVTAVRTGEESASGTSGVVGSALIGRYGTLVLNADGSYTYAIDMSNQEVMQAAGRGQVLQDTFTYSMVDRAGAADSAQLVVHLNISAPYVGGGSAVWYNNDAGLSRGAALPDIDPGLFVTPEVSRASTAHWLSGRNLYRDSDELYDEATRASTIGRGLGDINGQFVWRSVAESRTLSNFGLSRLLLRHGRTSLSADGLLPDPSLHATSLDEMLNGFMREAGASASAAVDTGAAAPKTAQFFSEQLARAAQKMQRPGALRS